MSPLKPSGAAPVAPENQRECKMKLSTKQILKGRTISRAWADLGFGYTETSLLLALWIKREGGVVNQDNLAAVMHDWMST